MFLTLVIQVFIIHCILYLCTNKLFVYFRNMARPNITYRGKTNNNTYLVQPNYEESTSSNIQRKHYVY